jgi:hypothetical protein
VDHPLDRANWINLKSKGFPHFVKQFAEQIKGSAVEGEMKKKWEGMDIGPWPLDEPQSQQEPPPEKEPDHSPPEETDPEPPNEAEKKNGDAARRDVALGSLRQIKSIDEAAWDKGRVEAVVPRGTMPESLPLNTLEAWEEAARKAVNEQENF